MADKLTADQRHDNMSHIKSRDTKPEKKARQALFRSGFRYRVNVKNLPGTPDIVLPKYRTAIFVNGCFWHEHKGCKYYTVSETNAGNMSETNLTERQRFILSIIKANPYVTGKAMSETLSVTQRTVERDLAVLQKAGIIRHEGRVNAGI